MRASSVRSMHHSRWSTSTRGRGPSYSRGRGGGVGEGGKTRDCFMAKRRGGAERYEGRSSFHRAFLHESTRQTCFTCSVRFRVYINIRVGITYSGVFSLLSLEITSIVEHSLSFFRFSFLASVRSEARGLIRRRERSQKHYKTQFPGNDLSGRESERLVNARFRG